MKAAPVRCARGLFSEGAVSVGVGVIVGESCQCALGFGGFGFFGFERRQAQGFSAVLVFFSTEVVRQVVVTV